MITHYGQGPKFKFLKREIKVSHKPEGLNCPQLKIIHSEVAQLGEACSEHKVIGALQ